MPTSHRNWRGTIIRDRWGSDDYSCLSRYDGLKYFRINALGAWCLGQTQHYQPEDVPTRKTWRVLPNHDVVSSELNPDPIDAMFLDKVADRTSDLVWRLDREKILTAVEDGLAIDAIAEFLDQHSSEPIPQTVANASGRSPGPRDPPARQGNSPHDRMRRRRDRPAAPG